MHRFVTRLSLVLSLTIASSCTLQINQIHYPNHAPTPVGHDPINLTIEESTTQTLDKPAVATRDTDRGVVDMDLGDPTSKADVEGLCERYEFPDIDEVPQIPYVPPEKRGDDDFISDLLVEHVNQLTEYIEEAERKINASYQEYIERCY